MQAFSYLQRNIADKKYIKLSLLGVVALAYLALTTLNPYLPPLFGVLIAAVYFVKRVEFTWFALLYLLFFELDRGYYLFSSWLFLFLFIHYLIPLVGSFLDCKRCIAALTAMVAYPLYYFMLNIADMFLLTDTVSISWAPILAYIVFEIFAASALE